MAASLFVELDKIELACRIAEAAIGRKRPKGFTAAQALAQLAAADRGTHDGFTRAAMAAMVYLKERVEAGSRVN